MSLLDIRGLEAGYGKLQVLFGLSMQVKEGEITVMIGPNGAGKSTVLKAMLNLCSIYNGTVKFQGSDITRLPASSRISAGISVVPQGRQVFGSLTVRENLEMGAYSLRGDSACRIRDVLRQFPALQDKLEQPASSLSGGQQQLLAMARALMQQPKLLLLDEPSLGLAPNTAAELFELIKGINASGTTVLMVEQNAKSACRIADRIFVLENGKVALHGGKELLKDERITRIYLGSGAPQ
ncbi:ABC transporter ATP-binding protein [Candidatus Woesearchaeota archaeon]|nr:ABC transporter ATP-binding protein [Candidatus Woesearchaeota archaeon]